MAGRVREEAGALVVEDAKQAAQQEIIFPLSKELERSKHLAQCIWMVKLLNPLWD